jgi:hypothetical protein
MTKLLLAAIAFAFCGGTAAMNLELPDGKQSTEGQNLVIPYAFYNENTESAVAVAVATTGYLQPQMSAVANMFYSSNDSSNFFVLVKDAQMPFMERLFLDVKLFTATWGETDSYQDGNPKFPDERAGSNDSDEDNFISADGDDDYYRFNFRYLLPIGNGKDNAIHTFHTHAGLLMDGYEAGGRAWNPLNSGRTIIEFEPFYRKQDLEDRNNNEFKLETAGATLALVYDNTDWHKNPARGSYQRIAISRDWGATGDDDPPWTSVEFEYSKYFSLPQTANSRQRVLAFNLWTSDVPTWDSSHTDNNGDEAFHRPPLFMGSTLGGLERQRGYSTNRFHDRSAINYTLEYRHTPSWNPFPDIPLINKLPIPWWQWVGFMEVGRVAENWTFRDLHSNMKFSAGGGIRLSVMGLIVRVDLAGSEEGTEVQMFIGHTFD